MPSLVSCKMSLAIANLNEFYVFPETAKKMELALRAHQKKGEYDAVNDAYSFAALLTEHLQEISHDKHLRVNFSPEVVPKGETHRTPEDEAQMRTELERDNCAFEKVERLPSNIDVHPESSRLATAVDLGLRIRRGRQGIGDT